MGYAFLGLAMIACVAGSSLLTASDGMKKSDMVSVAYLYLPSVMYSFPVPS